MEDTQDGDKLTAASDIPLWLYEDALPDNYPYDAMFPKSRVIDGVRMFPRLSDTKSTLTQ